MVDRAAARSEWRQHWPVVLASCAGMSLMPLVIYSIGLFIEPLESEFGWSRALTTSGLTINSIVSAVFATLIGVLIDRFGPRRIAIPGVFLFCLAFALLATLGGSPAHWWSLWLLVAVGSLLVSPTVWMAAVASRFSAARGLASALVLCGASVTSMAAPMLGGALIESCGWRCGFAGLAVIWFVVSMPLVLMFFHGAPDLDRAQQRVGNVQAAVSFAVAGTSWSAALRSATFLKLAAASALIILTLTATLVHFVPMVSAAGLERSVALSMMSVIGLSSVAGRLTTGSLLDRYAGARVGGVVFGLPTLAYVGLLAFDGSTALAVFIAVLIGFCSGAELEVASYLTARYFGTGNFGTLFGVIIALLAVAVGIGPLVVGHVYDQVSSYEPALWAALPICIGSSLLIFSLGKVGPISPSIPT